MKNRVCAAVALTLTLLGRPAPAMPTAAPRATTVTKPIVAPATLPPERAGDLYSAHARRLVRAYLRLRLLELHEAGLDRARAVIEGNLGVDALFSPLPRKRATR